MKNLHTLREQRANAAAHATAGPAQTETQPRDLSVGGAMQLSLNVEAEQLLRPQDLTLPLPLIKTEDCDRS